MDIELTTFKDVMLITPQRFEDDRGFFAETWSRSAMDAAGLAFDFVQDNHSLSREAGTIRGLHFQAPPHAQDKLVRCTRGAILDVAVDIRVGSPTYGQWVKIELTATNGHQLLIPQGFLHGFVTLQPDSEVQYKCSDYYAPECDGSVRWDSLGIDWGLTDLPVLSAKDATAMPFSDFQSPFVFDDLK
jgi:dTDP-4-dehydrorhamnose 3,5-epimerase